MDYFAALRFFVRAVELGSFSKAAADDNAKVSTVSRHISALESDLGAALFNRSTRRLHLTEAGTTLYHRAIQILDDLEEAKLATTSLNASPQGLIRINMPGAFGRRHIVPHLKDFLTLYPDIRVDATLTDVTVDLIDSGSDMAVRIGTLANSNLIAKRLAPQRRALVASVEYIREQGPIAEPHELARLECLTFALQPSDSWHFRPMAQSEEHTVGVAVRGRIRANDSEALLDAALAGLGVALLPTWLVGPEIRLGRLVTLLPNWECLLAPGLAPSIWGVYPPKKIVSPKVSVLLTFLEQRFGKPPYWDVETPSSVT